MIFIFLSDYLIDDYCFPGGCSEPIFFSQHKIKWRTDCWLTLSNIFFKKKFLEKTWEVEIWKILQETVDRKIYSATVTGAIL